MSLAPSPLAPVRPGNPTSAPRPRRRLFDRREPEAHVVKPTVATYAVWIASVAVLGTAWLVPETAWGAILGWMAALLMAYALRSRRGYLAAYAAGVVGHVIGFHWVFGTVVAFGGFGIVGAGVVFALFAGLGALQFLAIALIDRHLARSFDVLAIRSATAVVLAELLMPRLFPWHFGHTQIAFTPFVQVAGLGGSMAVTFLMFWMAEVAVRVAAFGERRRAFLVPVAVFGLALVYGMAMMDRFGSPRGEQQEVLLVQGQSAGPMIDPRMIRENVTRIYELSRQAAHPGSLIVWPEGAVPAYIPAAIGTVGDPPGLPFIGNGSACLVGGYSYLPNEERFNTAFAVYPDGEVPLPYFKQVLIPFGEYMPLASIFPGLNKLNPNAGVFSAGTETRVFTYPMNREDGSAYTLKVSPLICYEDTVPALAREAARKGAQLLVNISSDAWFGRSLAPHQHHLIAAFRAIENRRYLVRSTTTGLSAVVDPLGRTIARIPPFTEATARVTVSLLDYAGAYTTWVGDRPWWALLAVAVGSSLLGLKKGRAVRDGHVAA